MIIRGGRNLGSTCYFPKGGLAEPNEALASFLMQYYAETPPPAEILVNLELEEADALIAALGDRAGTTSRLWRPSRALPARWMAMTVENASQALRMRRARRADIGVMLADLAQLLRPRARAGAAGVLRHQPHGRRGHGGVLRGVWTRRPDEEGIPAFQHCRDHARR